jgi:23S rRNA pseudouridine1911/1915/1917 synthase
MKNIICETTYTVQVPDNKAGMRLDKLLAEAADGLSRARLKALMDEGRVFCGQLGGETVTDGAKKARPGDVFVICVPPAIAAEPIPQDIALDVVYEDADLIVINKPPGLVVHPAAGNADGTLVNALLAHCGASLSGIGGVARPGIVHRLDKGTGGLMVAAKNDAAHEGLSRQFADHSLDRAYMALVWGVPNPTKGEIEGQIGRSPQNRKKMAVLERGGKYALTRYKVLKAYGTVASLVECRLATGRTHQIRVHMTSIGCPLIGDPVYGGNGRSKRNLLDAEARLAVDKLDHQALFAYEIGFLHPKTQEKLFFRAEKPLFIKEIEYVLERV